MNKNFIFHPKNNTELQKTVKYFCSKKDSDFTDENKFYRKLKEDDTVLAKTIQQDNHTIYQIKIFNNNELFNPFSKLDRETSNSFLDNVVRTSNKFVNTNKLVFDYYIKFLLTQNIAWLNKAERERL